MEILLSRCSDDDDDDDADDNERPELRSFDSEIRDSVLPYMMERYPATELLLKSSLMDTNLGSRTLKALLLAPKLQSLDLTIKTMTKGGLLALLHGLQTDRTIQELSLSWLDHIDTEVCRAFQQLFQQNTTLKTLHLQSRLLSPRELRLAQRALDIGNNTTLTTLGIRLMPEYKLRLLMGDLMDDRSREHRIDCTELEMKLALNRAHYHAHLESSTAVTHVEFCNLLQQAGDNTSAHYILLKSWPHLWSCA